MIKRETRLVVADNSGAKEVLCINIVGGSGRQKTAHIGDTITVTVKKASTSGSVKTHDIVKCLIVRTSKETRRRDGSYIRFNDNACVVLDASKNPVGTRILGPIAREIREMGYIKISSLAAEVL